jgi:hypothetical protein
MELVARIVLIILVCILTAIILFIIRRYKILVKARHQNISKEEVVGRIFLRKLKKIDEASDREPPKELFLDLSRIMRNFFSELYDITYEFAYVELNEELVKKGVDEEKRKEIIDYTMEMEKSEYSNRVISKQEFYYLLGKSIHVIKSVTGYSEDDYALKRVPEKAVKAPHEGIPAEKPKPTGTEPGKVPKKAERPKEEKVAEKAAVPEEPAAAKPKPDVRIEKIRTLIIKAQNSLKDGKPEDAVESYTKMKELYDSLDTEKKISIHEETRNIIRIYNELLREYKELLTPE